jgi:hypothetical protein
MNEILPLYRQENLHVELRWRLIVEDPISSQHQPSILAGRMPSSSASGVCYVLSKGYRLGEGEQAL